MGLRSQSSRFTACNIPPHKRDLPPCPKSVILRQRQNRTTKGQTPTVQGKGSNYGTYQYSARGTCRVGVLRGQPVFGQSRVRTGAIRVGPNPEGVSGTGAQGSLAGQMWLCAGGGQPRVVHSGPAARGEIFQRPPCLAASPAESRQQCRQQAVLGGLEGLWPAGSANLFRSMRGRFLLKKTVGNF